MTSQTAAKQTRPPHGFKQRTWELLDVAKPGDSISKAVDIFILTLIFLNVAAVILGTVKTLEQQYGSAFEWFEIISVAIFSVEYVARVWACTVVEEYSHPISGRLRFMAKPMTMIDLLAVLPFYLAFVSADLRFVRAFRLFRIFRIAKLGRYSASIRLFGSVFKNKKEELVITLMTIVLLVIVASAFLYLAENEAQPDKYTDIPTAMWWSVVTLTTVGYGDVYPITALGKLFASLLAVLGIGMFALPAGILGASFVEEIQKRKTGKTLCPHCGKEIN